MPGRLRLRLPALRGDAAGLAALAEALAALPGVAAVQPFPTTGSLLLLHAGEGQAVLDRAGAAGLLVLRDANPPAPGPALPPGAALPAAGALAAVGLAAVQLLRKQALPPALTLGFYALRLARRARRRALRAG